jgi:hypothetical protein
VVNAPFRSIANIGDIRKYTQLKYLAYIAFRTAFL